MTRLLEQDTIQQALLDAFERAQNRWLRISDEIARDLASNLREFNRSLRATLTEVPWQVQYRTEMFRELQNLTARLQAEWTSRFQAGFEQTFSSLITEVEELAQRYRGVDLPTEFVSVRGLDPAMVTAFLEDGMQHITNLTNEMSQDIRSAITRSLLGGGTVLDAIETIGKTLNQGLTAKVFARAESILRTEFGRSVNQVLQSQLQTLQEIDVQYTKTWLTAQDERVRQTHQALHQQTIPLQDKFNVGGTLAYGPHDPALPAREVINCRCVIVLGHPEWEAIAQPVVLRRR